MRHILEEKGVKFKPADPVELPKEFNLRAFESIKIGPESLQQKLDSVVKYLRLPYVTDNFGTDAEARRAWPEKTKYQNF